MTRRLERVGNLIRNTIGQLLLGKISDPRIDPAKTSVTRVEVTEDFLTAKVFISVIGTDADQRRTLQALRHAAGHLQELMAQHIQLRHTPVLEFILDVTFKKTLKTLELIQQATEEIRRDHEAQQQRPFQDDSADEPTQR